MTRMLVACAIAAILASPVNAQSFPDRLIRIIVPFTPGGANDVVAREIATGLQDRFKQTAVVENKPGGGGTIAYSQVAKSPPDGYLLLIAPATSIRVMRPPNRQPQGESAAGTVTERLRIGAGRRQPPDALRPAETLSQERGAGVTIASARAGVQTNCLRLSMRL